MGDMDDLVKDFLVESQDNLDKLDQGFMAMEQDPGDRERLAGIFRSIHTIKGTSGFFGFSRLQAVCHAGESLLAKLRDGQLQLTQAMSTALLAMSDRVRALLAEIGRSGAEGEGDDQPLIGALVALTSGQAVPAPEAPPASAAPSAPGTGATTAREHATTTHPAAGRTTAVDPVDTTLRVDVHLLDRLMNLVGELVLARNQILARIAALPRSELHDAAGRLNGITTELQEGVMKTRLQPIGGVWAKLPRVVRDLSLQIGKKVRVEQDGKETELDKTIIEAIKDPLTHMVRNSVDHGIERPADRIAAGKPEEGVIRLRAYHDGGQVVLVLEDDGRGIDPEKVRRKAVEKGLITDAQAAALGDREAVNLIFAPGFSTAEQVTNISGRGVGMDVVRTNIERIGGTVDVGSRPGAGTTITVRIPLTLAIVPAMVVGCDGHRFAIPQVALRELVSIAPDRRAGCIETVYGAPVLRLRGRLLPLVSLAAQLGLREAEPAEPTRIVIVQADHRQYGLIVGSVHDTQEIVVKPLGSQLKGLSAYSGATVMGDGRLALILDVVGLGTRAQLSARAKAEEAQAAGPVAGARTPLLLFRSPDEGRMAIALDEVARLEEFDADAVERTGGHELVQYRGEIMPLIRVFAVLPERRRALRAPEAGVRPGRLPVVVVRHDGRSLGLVVGEILDTLEQDLAGMRPASRACMRGCVVVAGKVTELLDVPALIAAARLPEPVADGT